MSGRTRAVLESCAILALLALAAVIEHAGSGVERRLIALGIVFLGTAFRRWLVLRGRAAPLPAVCFVFEVAAFSGLFVLPIGAWAHGLAGFAALAFAPSLRSEGSPRASRLEEGFVLLLALAGVELAVSHALVHGELRSNALLLLLLLGLEAYRAGAPRGVDAAARRAVAFALAGAAAFLADYEWFGPTPEVVLFVLASLATARAVDDARYALASIILAVAELSRAPLGPASAALVAVAAAGALVSARERSRLGWASWLALALLLFGWAHSDAPVQVSVHASSAVGVLVVGLVACAVYVGVARGLTTGDRPGGAAIAAATIMASIAAVEGGLRVKRNAHPDFLTSFNPVPLVATTARTLVREDAQARNDFRDRPFSPAKPAKTYRVALLGASSTWGHAQERREESLPGRLEARLAGALPGARPEVLCLAFPGLSADQELGLVAGAALGWGADLFLAIDGYNDVAYLANAAAYPGDMYSWPQHRYGLERPFLHALLRHSTILSPVVGRALQIPSNASDDLRATNGFYLDGIVANEEAIAILARDAGAAFAWASVPLVHDRSRLGADEAAASSYRERVARTAEVRRRVGPAVAAQGGVVLDLAARIGRMSLLAPDERWFMDECHYTDRGMDVLAQATVEALAEAKVLPP